MRLIYLLFAAMAVPMAVAEPLVEMESIRVTPSQMYFRLQANDHDEIEKIEVISVEADSPAARLGIQKGDLVTFDSGAPVVGRKKSTMVGPNRGIAFHGQVTFEGHRGFLRKKWSLTIDAKNLKKKEPNPSSEPTPPGRSGSS